MACYLCDSTEGIIRYGKYYVCRTCVDMAVLCELEKTSTLNKQGDKMEAENG